MTTNEPEIRTVGQFGQFSDKSSHYAQYRPKPWNSVQTVQTVRGEAIRLLDDCEVIGVVLQVEEGNIRYRGPADAVTPAFVERIRSLKPELLTLLLLAQDSIVDRAIGELPGPTDRTWVDDPAEHGSIKATASDPFRTPEEWAPIVERCMSAWRCDPYAAAERSAIQAEASETVA